MTEKLETDINYIIARGLIDGDNVGLITKRILELLEQR